MPSFEVIKGRIIWVSRQSQYLVKKNKVFCSKNGRYWASFFELPVNFVTTLLLSVPLVPRLLRLGIHHFVAANDKEVILFNKSLYKASKGSLQLPAPIVGSRPLFLCHVDGNFYYGEYRGNKEGTPVHIWCDEIESDAWYSVWTFNNVRHVHGVFYDEYTSSIWVTTGDSNEEAAIWNTEDNFKTLEKVVSGSQQVRAVQLLFTSSHVYFGSDAPDEKNFIYRMHRDGSNVEQLQEVSSSVFYGCKVGESLFFSTAIEPSKVNKSRAAEVWRSDNGKEWYLYTSFKKDLFSMKYFQYGQVLFPSGKGDDKYLYCYLLATEGHGKTIKFLINLETVIFSV